MILSKLTFAHYRLEVQMKIQKMAPKQNEMEIQTNYIDIFRYLSAQKLRIVEYGTC